MKITTTVILPHVLIKEGKGIVPFDFMSLYMNILTVTKLSRIINNQFTRKAAIPQDKTRQV